MKKYLYFLQDSPNRPFEINAVSKAEVKALLMDSVPDESHILAIYTEEEFNAKYNRGSNRPQQINEEDDTEYNQKVFNALCDVGKELKSLNIKIDGWAIDAGGRNWDAVCQFSKKSISLVGVPAGAFAGRSSTLFNPYVRSRLRDAIGRTVLCGNADEHVKSGSG
jgi:hypothetical protein